MATYKGRLASREDLFYAYVACSLPIFLWAFYKLFRDTPAWILRMSVLDILSVLAYSLAISVLESLIIWGLFVLLGFLLPEARFRRKFVPLVMAITLVSAIWAVNAQFNYAEVFDWSFSEALPWLVLSIFTIIVGYLLVLRSDRLANLIYKLVKGLSVLTSVYIILGLIGIVVVIFRNL